MRLKFGVRLAGVKPELAIGMIIVNNQYERAGAELIVTSCNDSTHGSGSLHYAGRAFDCRTKWVMSRESVLPLHDAIRDALGEEWDVVLEDYDGDNEHIHVEWDPK